MHKPQIHSFCPFVANFKVYRISSGQLLCQTLLTRAQGNQLGTFEENSPSKNVLCENGNNKKSEGHLFDF